MHYSLVYFPNYAPICHILVCGSNFQSIDFSISYRHGQVSFLDNFLTSPWRFFKTLTIFYLILCFSFGDDNPWRPGDSSGLPPHFDQGSGDPVDYVAPSPEELEQQIRELANAVASGNLEPLYYAVATVAAAFAIPICRDLLSRLGDLPIDNRVVLCTFFLYPSSPFFAVLILWFFTF